MSISAVLVADDGTGVGFIDDGLLAATVIGAVGSGIVAVEGALIAGDGLADVINGAKDISNTRSRIETNEEYYYTAKAKAKELAAEYTDRKSTGSYTITFASGKTYSGKGGVKRAIESAAVRSTEHTTMPENIDWTPAASHAD